LVYVNKVLYTYKGTIPANTPINNIRADTVAIAEGAFRNSNLTSITIPANVTSIGREAFRNSSLTSITILASIISIGKEAFSGTMWLNSQPYGVVYAGKVLYTYKGTMPVDTTINIRADTVSIAENAFISCWGLSSVAIPASVITIGDGAFYNCSNLTDITIPEGVAYIGNGAFSDCPLPPDIRNDIIERFGYAPFNVYLTPGYF